MMPLMIEVAGNAINVVGLIRIDKPHKKCVVFYYSDGNRISLNHAKVGRECPDVSSLIDRINKLRLEDSQSAQVEPRESLVSVQL